jgi:glycosyltransferase involved in cell wall biosynthesis
MVRYSILTPSLKIGGAEKNAVLLANELVLLGFTVDLVCVNAIGELSHKINQRVNVIDLKASRFRECFLKLRKYIKTRHPSVIHARAWPLTFIAAIVAYTIQPRPRVVCSEHSILSMSLFIDSWKMIWLLRLTLAITYRLCDVAFTVTKGAARDLENLGWLKPNSIECLPNMCEALPRNQEIPRLISNFVGNKKVILCVANLKRIKNLFFLLKSIKELSRYRTDFVVLIVGDGPDRSELEDQISSLKIQHLVNLVGNVVDVGPFYQMATLFALTSDSEGFVNVLVEALYFGLDIVSVDCPTGPREILMDGQYGTLVRMGSEELFAAALDNQFNYRRDPENQRRRANDFSPKAIMRRYIQLVNK